MITLCILFMPFHPLSPPLPPVKYCSHKKQQVFYLSIWNTISERQIYHSLHLTFWILHYRRWLLNKIGNLLFSKPNKIIDSRIIHGCEASRWKRTGHLWTLKQLCKSNMTLQSRDQDVISPVQHPVLASFMVGWPEWLFLLIWCNVKHIASPLKFPCQKLFNWNLNKSLDLMSGYKKCGDRETG